jgi:hypothetical protein
MQGWMVGGGYSYIIFDLLPDGQLTQITSYSTRGPYNSFIQVNDREQGELLNGLEKTGNYDFWSDIIIGR